MSSIDLFANIERLTPTCYVSTINKIAIVKPHYDGVPSTEWVVIDNKAHLLYGPGDFDSCLLYVKVAT